MFISGLDIYINLRNAIGRAASKSESLPPIAINVITIRESTTLIGEFLTIIIWDHEKNASETSDSSVVYRRNQVMHT